MAYHMNQWCNYPFILCYAIGFDPKGQLNDQCNHYAWWSQPYDIIISVATRGQSQSNYFMLTASLCVLKHWYCTRGYLDNT